VAHAERPGAEARDRAAGLERIARGLGAVEDLEAVAERVGEHDEGLDPPPVGERPRTPRQPYPGPPPPRPQNLERRPGPPPPPSPPSSFTTTRCLRSSIRSARLLLLLSTSCMPRKFVPNAVQSSSDFARTPT